METYTMKEKKEKKKPCRWPCQDLNLHHNFFQRK